MCAFHTTLATFDLYHSVLATFDLYHSVLCPPIDTDTVWPMMVGFFAKLALGGMESFLLTKGVAQLAIRKMSNTIAASVRATTRENHAAHPS